MVRRVTATEDSTNGVIVRHNSLLAAHCSLLAARCSLLAARCSLLATRYLLFATHCLKREISSGAISDAQAASLIA